MAEFSGQPRRLETWLKSTTALVSAGIVSGLAMSATPALAQDDEEVADEVIVTGSYIRRGNFDSASPINIVDQSDLLREARPQMGEVIRNQTFNYGTTTVDNIEGTQFQFGTFSLANLRGLGPGATLTLMDGRRSVTGNVNLMYPQIAIQRIETLLDGAAALYGTDAVAGVVNFIPFRNYEGMEVALDVRTDDQWDTQEVNFSALFGGSTGRTSVVGAIDIRDRTRLRRFDRPRYSEASQGEPLLFVPDLAGLPGLGFLAGYTDQPGFLVGGNNVPNGAPGSWQIPLRDFVTGDLIPQGFGLAGAGTNFRVARDPGCGNPNFSVQGFDQINQESGLPAVGGAVVDGNGFAVEACGSSFADLADFIADQESVQGYMSVTHEISDNWTFEGEVVFNRLDAKARGFLGVVGGRFQDVATVPGELPGNPFTATLSIPDLGANGGNPFLFPVFAQDDFNNETGAAGADGIPDRQTDPFDPAFDRNSDGLGDVILQGGAPISADDLSPGLAAFLVTALGFPDFDPGAGFLTFLPASANPANGGIMFQEDVRVNDAVFGGKNLNPLPTFAQNFADDGTGPFAGTYDQQTWRYGGTLRHEFENSNWLWQGSVFYHLSQANFSSTDNSLNQINLGLQGLLLTQEVDPETGDEIRDYFNPFSTAQFDPNRTQLTGPGSTDTTSEDAAFNSQQVVDRIFTDRIAVARDRVITVDTFVSGDLFDVDAGSIGAALGFHYRHERAQDNQPVIETIDDQFVDRQELDSFSQRDVWAIFAELAIPVFDSDSMGSLEVQAAGRYEDYGGDLNSFDPKIGILWRGLDDTVAIRGSWGTSFVAPSLDQMFGPPSSFLRNTTDPLTGIGPIFVTTENNSNPNLVAEEAETWNFGISWEPVENLVLTADHWRFDFTDRLVLLTGQDNLNINALQFLVAGNDPTDEGDVQDWIDNSETIVRRLSDNTQSFISGGWRNASSIKTDGWDFGISYLMAGEDVGLGSGTFTFNAQASWMETYKLQVTSAFDLTSVDPAFLAAVFPDPTNNPAIVSDRAGLRNDPTTVVPPLPEWRINANVGWISGAHSVNVNMRFIDSIPDDAIFAQLGLNIDALGPDQIIPSHTEFDIQYTYNWDQGVFGDGRTTTITVGSINVLDNDPPAFNTLGGLESFLHDPRGRILYARFGQIL